jgi:vacuolar protein sorting-associated protein 16
MIGPYGDWLRFPYEGVENLYIVPEIDCCRVVTASSIDIVQRVPPQTALLLRIGSIEASAMLLDAADSFHSGSPASDETTRSLINGRLLSEAVESCTESAAKEFDIYTQKRLLRAASYGMHFSYKTRDIDDVDLNPEDENFPAEAATKFVNTARKLRVLNALRNPNVGFLLTSAQFDSIKPTGIIARLIAMKRPALATAISLYLSMPKSVQLFCRASKASAFVESNRRLSDIELIDTVVAMVSGKSSNAQKIQRVVSRGVYATIAMSAHRAGRAKVANELLVFESSVCDKIPALMSFGNYSDAMSAAATARYVKNTRFSLFIHSLALRLTHHPVATIILFFLY